MSGETVVEKVGERVLNELGGVENLTKLIGMDGVVFEPDGVSFCFKVQWRVKIQQVFRSNRFGEVFEEWTVTFFDVLLDGSLEPIDLRDNGYRLACAQYDFEYVPEYEVELQGLDEFWEVFEDTTGIGFNKEMDCEQEN